MMRHVFPLFPSMNDDFYAKAKKKTKKKTTTTTTTKAYKEAQFGALKTTVMK